MACELHAAWKQWQADLTRNGHVDHPEEEDDFEYKKMIGDPLKNFQDPQVRHPMSYVLSIH
jgi:hypothetical protein